MPVNSTHPDYDAAATEWARARDVLAGEDAVKAGGEKYVPRLDSQTDEEFAAYVQRASFFNATARTTGQVTVTITLERRNCINEALPRTSAGPFNS